MNTKEIKPTAKEQAVMDGIKRVSIYITWPPQNLYEVARAAIQALEEFRSRKETKEESNHVGEKAPRSH
jgi:hypothetical protein